MQSDDKYVELLLTPLNECRRYKPAFGRNEDEGVDLPAFRALYGQDPLYHWLGIDDDLMYAAHKAAGGMTSIYRQLGIGCERLLRQIIQDALHLDAQAVAWSYEYDKGDGRTAVHTLDARISLCDLINQPEKYGNMKQWLADVAAELSITEYELKGAIFEIRQGYKSADSKRQNADLRFGLRAYTEAAHLPVIMIVSTQASNTVCARYRAANILVTTGSKTGQHSTLLFFRDVVGYDLADFLERNKTTLRSSVREILSALLSPTGAV